MSVSLTNADVQNILLKPYEVFWDNESMGVTQEGGTSIPLLSDVVVADDVEQSIGIVAAVERAINSDEITTTFYRADEEFIRSKILKNRVAVDTSGAASRFHTGISNNDLRSKAKILRLHPTSNASDDYSQDLYFHLAIPTISAPIAGSRDNFQTLEVTWRIFPDFDQGCEGVFGKQYGIYGDWSFSVGTPIGSWIQTGDKGFNTSAKSITAASIQVGEVQKFYGFSAFGTSDSITLDIDNAGGYTATDTAFLFDNLSTAGGLVTGRYIEIGGTGEYCKITNVSYSNAGLTEGTITVETRGDVGTQDLAAAIVDNDTLTQYQVARVNKTDAGTWASSVTANVVVGNTVQNGSVAEASAKGVLTHGGSAGASNISFTFGAVASPDLVATSL